MKLSTFIAKEAQPVAETLSVLEIYLDELLAESDDTSAAKNVVRAMRRHHKALHVAAKKLGIDYADESSDGIVAFSNNTTNKDDDEEETQP